MDSVQKKNVNYCLNFLKGLACFFVIYMHTSFDSKISSVIVCAGRFAVPLFFIISGYYCVRETSDQKKSITRKLIKTLKVCIIYEIVYFVFGALITPLLNGENINIISYCKKIFTFQKIINLILFNQSLNSGILWFVYALLYCYILMLFVYKNKKHTALYIIGLTLLLAHILGRGTILYFNIIPEKTNIIWFRDFIFMGAPFFIMGLFIKEYETKIRQVFSNNILIICLAVVGLLFSFVERYFVPLEVFFGSTIVVFMLFVFSLNNKEKKVFKPVCIVGKKYYMNEYLWHIIVNALLVFLLATLKINFAVINIFKPLIIYLLIVILTLVFRKVRSFLPSKK